jgi:4'-phosphopantetheinyl transferase
VTRELALWVAHLDEPGPGADVTDDERARAAQYRDALDGARFLASRAWLRRLLGGELGCAPADVPIVTAPEGKPFLEHGELRFSASRSGDVALFATSWTTDVGVDVEAVRDEDLDALTERMYSMAEQRALAGLAEPDRRFAAFGCWARKEAYVKATGTGIGVRLAELDVGIGGAGPVTHAGWTVHDVALGHGLAAAVAGVWPEEWVPDRTRQLSQ